MQKPWSDHSILPGPWNRQSLSKAGLFSCFLKYPRCPLFTPLGLKRIWSPLLRLRALLSTSGGALLGPPHTSRGWPNITGAPSHTSGRYRILPVPPLTPPGRYRAHPVAPLTPPGRYRAHPVAPLTPPGRYRIWPVPLSHLRGVTEFYRCPLSHLRGVTERIRWPLSHLRGDTEFCRCPLSHLRGVTERNARALQELTTQNFGAESAERAWWNPHALSTLSAPNWGGHSRVNFNSAEASR